MKLQHVVLKLDDINKYLEENEKDELANIIGKIQLGRNSDNKTMFNKYIVINTDELYIQDIISVLKANNHWD